MLFHALCPWKTVDVQVIVRVGHNVVLQQLSGTYTLKVYTSSYLLTGTVIDQEGEILGTAS